MPTACTYPAAALGALPASMLLTLHFSQQKFTEYVLQHVCNIQMFIKILGTSLLISQLMLLMHHVLPFLLVGPSGKESQTPSHIWYLTKHKIQQKYGCISTVQGWCCPVLAMAALLHFMSVSLKPKEPNLNTSVPLHVEHYVGKSNHSLPMSQQIKVFSYPSERELQVGSEDKKLRTLER